MAEPFQRTLVDDNTNGTKAAVDVRNLTAISVFAKAVGGTSADLALEGTNDPAGQLGYAALAQRLAGGGAYATTARTVTAGGGVALYLDPSDNVTWIRAVVTNQTGPTQLTATVSGEA